MTLLTACYVQSAPSGQPATYPSEPPPEYADNQPPSQPQQPPASIDCSEQPNRMCCEGQTAECMQCRSQAQDERAQWQAACQPSGQPQPPNSGPLIPDDPSYPRDDQARNRTPPAPPPLEKPPARRRTPQRRPPSNNNPGNTTPPAPPPLEKPPARTPTMPSQRPDQYVPSRRSRLGNAAKFSIEPTAGPVGTVVTIYGDFRAVNNTRQINVSFQGVRRAEQPIYTAGDRVAVEVPNGAKSGNVIVRVKGKRSWAGRFSVTASDDGIFVPTPVDSGLLGAVYQLPENTKNLPDFDSLGDPYATITLPNLSVAARRFENGFPGISDSGDDLLEWFGIRFVGMITVPSSGNYQFRINSDDGARLYIDGKRVLDNDGQHAPRARDGSVSLSAGVHDIVVEYFQGPRYQIALELFWNQGGSWEIVPASAFSRYVGGYDCDDQPQIYCCAGNSASCRQCRDNAAQQRAAWNRFCSGNGGQPPSAPNPGTPVDCDQVPNRVCCQAQTAGCQQCRTQAAAERSQWVQACQSTVNCSRRPRPRPCCKALTAQCRTCQRESAAEQDRWNALCGK